MNSEVYTEPFDFALYPYSLGDTLNWCVFSAIRALAAGRRRVEVLICLDPAIPHNRFQSRPNQQQYQLMFSEVLPAFYVHPLPITLMIFHDRAQFNQMLEDRARAGSLMDSVLAEYRDVYAQRENDDRVVAYFIKMVNRHDLINAYHAQTGAIPWLREVIGCQADVENLIRAQGEGARIVTIQFRLRNLDQAIPGDALGLRDADYFVWERFLVEAQREFPQVRFALLGRLQEKPLCLLGLPNVIAPRLLGLNLAHELSLLQRSHLYFGSSSGFAACANFSQTPYRIFNLTPNACESYGIPYQTDRLPFALANQRLLYGKETAKQLLDSLGEALAEVGAAERSGISPRTERAGLTPAHPSDATTFRFIPDVRQARHELVLLAQASVSRVKKNLVENHPAGALVELEQLQLSLAQTAESFCASSPVADPPLLGDVLKYWWCRLRRQPYLRPLPRVRVDFTEFTPQNSFLPQKWVCNDTLKYVRQRPPASLRFRKSGPNSFLKSESFRARHPAVLKLVFQARRPTLPPQSSIIHLWENGQHRTLAGPLYTPQWTTYCYEFVALPDAELHIQFDNDFPGHWLHLRNVFVGNAVASQD